jgi:hypothetical protein
MRSGERELALDLVRKKPWRHSLIQRLQAKWRRSRAFVLDVLHESIRRSPTRIGRANNFQRPANIQERGIRI